MLKELLNFVMFYINRIEKLCTIKVKRFIQGRSQRFLQIKKNLEGTFVTQHPFSSRRSKPMEDFYSVVDIIIQLIKETFFPMVSFLGFKFRTRKLDIFRRYRVFKCFSIKLFYSSLFKIENFIENRKAKYPNRVKEIPSLWERIKGVKRYPFYIRLIDNAYQKFLDLFFSFYNIVLKSRELLYSLLNKTLNKETQEYLYTIFLSFFALLFVIFLFLLFFVYIMLFFVYINIINIFVFLADWITRQGDFKTTKFPTHSSLIFFVISYFICELMLLYLLTPLCITSWIIKKIYRKIYKKIIKFIRIVTDARTYINIFILIIFGIFDCFTDYVFNYFFDFSVNYNILLNDYVSFLFLVFSILGFIISIIISIIKFITNFFRIESRYDSCHDPDHGYLALLFVILLSFLDVIEEFFFVKLIIFFDINLNLENIYNLEGSNFLNIFFYPANWMLYIYSSYIINPYIILFVFPLLFSFFLFFFKNKTTIKISSLAFSLLFFIYIIYLCILFNNNKESLQFVYKGIFGISPLTYSFYFAFDGISLSLVLLTAFLIPLCLLTLNTIHNKIKEFIILLFITQIFLNIAFTTFNLLVFYVAFEAILIPMFILILIWGSRERKIRSVYLLFFYTLVGSVPFLLSICYLINIGSTDNIIYLNSSGYHLNIPFKVQEILCYCFTLSFAVKMPMFPIHIWLPEAHVEAPTSGSILLAGILLKLGGYGFFRFCLPLFSEAMQSISPLIIMLSLLGIFYIGIITLVQEDLKKIIAYSSVAHMNLVIIALFSNNLEAFQSSIVVMISHGIVSGGLFYIIGALYNVSHTRSLFEHGGLASVMPLFTFFFLTLTFANISLPGTISFVGEFLIFQSIINYSYLATFLAMTTVIFGAAYSLFLLCRLCYGNLKLQFISYYRDLILKDNIVLIVICFLIIFFGFNPKGITDLIIAASFFY
jgi:NADH-quinone oxidoreductase subunit M